MIYSTGFYSPLLIYRSQLRWAGNPLPWQETQDVPERIHLLRYCPGGAGEIAWGRRARVQLVHDPEPDKKMKMSLHSSTVLQQVEYVTDSVF